jgi:hypothetical protein
MSDHSNKVKSVSPKPTLKQFLEEFWGKETYKPITENNKEWLINHIKKWLIIKRQENFERVHLGILPFQVIDELMEDLE